MKKIIFFMIIGVISLVMSGCHAFDSTPIEPIIIGTGNISFSKGKYGVEIDSVYYPINYVFTGEKDVRLGASTMRPVKGMQVTVYRPKNFERIEFVAGERDEAFIENLFHQNNTAFVIIFVAMAIGIILTLLWSMKWKND